MNIFTFLIPLFSLILVSVECEELIYWQFRDANMHENVDADDPPFLIIRTRGYCLSLIIFDDTSYKYSPDVDTYTVHDNARCEDPGNPYTIDSQHLAVSVIPPDDLMLVGDLEDCDLPEYQEKKTSREDTQRPLATLGFSGFKSEYGDDTRWFSLYPSLKYRLPGIFKFRTEDFGNPTIEIGIAGDTFSGKWTSDVDRDHVDQYRCIDISSDGEFQYVKVELENPNSFWGVLGQGVEILYWLLHMVGFLLIPFCLGYSFCVMLYWIFYRFFYLGKDEVPSLIKIVINRICYPASKRMFLIRKLQKFAISTGLCVSCVSLGIPFDALLVVFALPGVFFVTVVDTVFWFFFIFLFFCYTIGFFDSWLFDALGPFGFYLVIYKNCVNFVVSMTFNSFELLDVFYYINDIFEDSFLLLTPFWGEIFDLDDNGSRITLGVFMILIWCCRMDNMVYFFGKCVCSFCNFQMPFHLSLWCVKDILSLKYDALMIFTKKSDDDDEDEEGMDGLKQSLIEKGPSGPYRRFGNQRNRSDIALEEGGEGGEITSEEEKPTGAPEDVLAQLMESSSEDEEDDIQDLPHVEHEEQNFGQGGAEDTGKPVTTSGGGNVKETLSHLSAIDLQKRIQDLSDEEDDVPKRESMMTKSEEEARENEKRFKEFADRFEQVNIDGKISSEEDSSEEDIRPDPVTSMPIVKEDSPPRKKKRVSKKTMEEEPRMRVGGSEDEDDVGDISSSDEDAYGNNYRVPAFQPREQEISSLMGNTSSEEDDVVPKKKKATFKDAERTIKDFDNAIDEGKKMKALDRQPTSSSSSEESEEDKKRFNQVKPVDRFRSINAPGEQKRRWGSGKGFGDDEDSDSDDEYEDSFLPGFITFPLVVRILYYFVNSLCGMFYRIFCLLTWSPCSLLRMASMSCLCCPILIFLFCIGALVIRVYDHTAYLAFSYVILIFFAISTAAAFPGCYHMFHYGMGGAAGKVFYMIFGLGGLTLGIVVFYLLTFIHAAMISYEDATTIILDSDFGSMIGYIMVPILLFICCFVPFASCCCCVSVGCCPISYAARSVLVVMPCIDFVEWDLVVFAKSIVKLILCNWYRY